MRDENQNSALMQAKVEWYKEVVLLDPQSKLFLSYARLLAELGVLENNPDYYNEAFRVLRAGIEKHPDFMEARLFLIELLHSCDCKAQCGAEVAHLASLFLSYPDFWDAWRVHAGLENQSEDFTVALGFMGAILKDRSLSLVKVFEAGLSALRVEQNANLTMSKELLQGVECAFEQPLKSDVGVIAGVQSADVPAEIEVAEGAPAEFIDEAEEPAFDNAEAVIEGDTENDTENLVEVVADVAENAENSAVDENEDNVELEDQSEQVAELEQAEQNEQADESVEDVPSADVAEETPSGDSQASPEEAITDEVIAESEEAEQDSKPKMQSEAKKVNAPIIVKAPSKPTISLNPTKVKPKISIVTGVAPQPKAPQAKAEDSASTSDESQGALEEGSIKAPATHTANVQEGVASVAVEAPVEVNTVEQTEKVQKAEITSEEILKEEIVSNEVAQESSIENKMPQEISQVISSPEEVLQEKSWNEMESKEVVSDTISQNEIQEDAPQDAPEADFSLAGKGISEDDLFVPVAVDAIDLSDAETKDGKPTVYESKDNVKDVLAALLANSNIVEEPMEQSPFRTRSMAEVLAEQGDIKGAIDIYAELIAKQESALIDGDGSADGLELSSLLKRRKELEVRQHLSVQASANDEGAEQNGWSAAEVASESFENDLPENELLNQIKSQAQAQDDGLQNQSNSEQALTENTDDDTSNNLEVDETSESGSKTKDSKTKSTDKAVDILNKLAMRLEAKAS